MGVSRRAGSHGASTGCWCRYMAMQPIHGNSSQKQLRETHTPHYLRYQACADVRQRACRLTASGIAVTRLKSRAFTVVQGSTGCAVCLRRLLAAAAARERASERLSGPTTIPILRTYGCTLGHWMYVCTCECVHVATGGSAGALAPTAPALAAGGRYNAMQPIHGNVHSSSYARRTLHIISDITRVQT